MKKKYLIALLLLVLCSFTFSDLFYKKTLVYNNSLDKSQTTWIIRKKNKDFNIDKTNLDGLTQILYSPKYVLKELTFESVKEKSNYKYTFQNNKLTAQGKTKGKNIRKVYKIIKGQWIQDFNFGFMNFLDATSKRFKFIMINPSDFSINEMVAIKERIETISIHGTTYNTQKLKVTLQGFKSHFWKAEIWYDLKSKDLIKYVSNEGPGTPTETVSLNSKN